MKPILQNIVYGASRISFFTLSKACLSLALIIGLLTVGCKKSPHDPEDPVVVTGEKKPVGESAGEAISYEVGPEGGRLYSADHQLRIDVPAGALTETIDISIEPITNTNPAAIGAAYRLAPHNLQFEKPVTVSFSYETQPELVNIPSSLGLAWQDEDGIWQFTGTGEVNTSSHYVSVAVPHFSDWSMMPWLSLYPTQAVLSESDEIDIEAKVFIPFKECDCPLDMVVPLNFDKSYPVGSGRPLNKKYIKNWELLGPGTLIPVTGNDAVYKAPAHIPVNTEAAVKVTLQSSQTLILLSQISLVSDNSFEIRMNGGAWKPVSVGLILLQEGRLSIATTGAGPELLSMYFPNKAGNYYWGSNSNGDVVTAFNYFPTGNVNDGYAAFYWNTTEQAERDSGGYIEITELGGLEGFTVGRFIINPAGHLADGEYKGVTVIEGRFRLKRAF